MNKRKDHKKRFPLSGLSNKDIHRQIGLCEDFIEKHRDSFKVDGIQNFLDRLLLERSNRIGRNK